MFFFSDNGNDIIIESNNKIIYRLDVNLNKIIYLDGMIVEIKDRKVRVKDADCPNKLCVKQGWISRGSIICVPKKIVIYFSNYKKNVIDATTR